jgi:WD40 repeat protein
LLEGHAGRVTDLAFNEAGTLLASGSEDASLRVWNVESGAEIAALFPHTTYVNGVSFAPSDAAEGDLLVSTSWDRTASIITVEGETTETRETLEGYLGVIETVAFSPDGSQFALGVGDGTVRVIDRDTLEEDRRYMVEAPRITALAYGENGLVAAASGFPDEALYLWDATGDGDEPLLTVATFDGAVTGLVFLAEGVLAAVDSAGTVQVWRLEDDTLTELAQLTLDGTWFTDVTAGDALLAASTLDGEVLLWELDADFNPTLNTTLDAHSDGVSALALHAADDALTLATGGDDGLVRLWAVTAR